MSRRLLQMLYLKRNCRQVSEANKFLCHEEAGLCGHVVAIEIELSIKGYARLEKILRCQRSQDQTVWYFCTDRSGSVIKKALETLPESLADQPTAALFAAMMAESVGVNVCLFPASNFDGWRGDDRAILNRLMAVESFSEPYYKAVTKTVLGMHSAIGQRVPHGVHRTFLAAAYMNPLHTEERCNSSRSQPSTLIKLDA